jgi:hypothetical protein
MKIQKMNLKINKNNKQKNEYVFVDTQLAEIEDNKRLMAAFFRSVTSVLVPSAEVHVTHKMKAPFCYWNLKDLAAAANSELHYTRRLVFDPSLFPAYNNRKVASGRGKFPTWDAAVYVWTKGKPPRRIRKGVFSVASSGQRKSLLLQPLLTEAKKVFAKEREKETERFHRQGAIGSGRGGGGGGKECLLDTPGLFVCVRVCVCVCVPARGCACMQMYAYACRACVYTKHLRLCVCVRASERACVHASVRACACTCIHTHPQFPAPSLPLSALLAPLPLSLALSHTVAILLSPLMRLRTRSLALSPPRPGAFRST